jgi:hypothetical protein
MNKTSQLTGLNRVRGVLYWLARGLGDIQAVKKRKVGRRIARRTAGRAAGHLLRRLIK